MQTLRERILWQYPFAAATAEPAKTTVSVLRRRAVEEADDEARRLFESKVPSSRFQNAGRRSSSAGALSAAARGTAHHTFQELVELERTGSTVELRNEAERLKNEGVLSAEEVAALDFDGLVSFWQSEMGRRIRARSADTHRELPFTVRFTATELAAVGIRLDGVEDGTATTADFIVVQGAVDLAVILPDEIWLVDFKTDQVRPAELADKAGFYAPQLQLYALALERIYQRPVRERWLHFLELGRSVAVAGGG